MPSVRSGVEKAFFGHYQPGAALGSVFGPRWVAVTTPGSGELIAAVEALVAYRQGSTAEIAEASLPSLLNRYPPPLAVCILGTKMSFEAERVISATGISVGRLPFDDPDCLSRVSERQVELDRIGRRSAKRRAWIVAPCRDGFTRALAQHRESIEDTLVRAGFDIVRSPEEGPCSLALLLTHGDANPSSGKPEMAAKELEYLKHSCGFGATVVHLGCNGAGAAAGSRFLGLEAGLGLRDTLPIHPDGAFSTFAKDCLLAGSAGVVAHVDVTWSTALSTGMLPSELSSWICLGAGSIGYAVQSTFHEHAFREGTRAYRAVLDGNDLGAGYAWWRSVDLGSFTTIGDPSLLPFGGPP